MLIEENLFDEAWLALEGKNNLTNVLCNEWNNNSIGTGIEILEGSVVLASWGDQFNVSGNINDNDPRPILSFPGSGSNVTNYYNNSVVPQRFNYYGLIAGSNINYDDECTYDLWPAFGPDVNEFWSESPEDLGNLDDEYENADDVIDGYYNELAYLSGASAENKRHQIGQAQVALDDIVRRALEAAQASDSNNIDIWLERVDTKLIDLTKFFALWYAGQFSLLSMRLDLIGDDDAEVLKDASNYMLGIINEDVSMFELNTEELEDLTELAEMSYGDYTNILRTFLDAEYGISIIRPDELIPRDFSSKARREDGTAFENENNYKVIPNPTYDCVRILPGSTVSNNFKGDVFDSVGNMIYSYSSLHSNAFICFGDATPGLYFVTVKDLDSGVTEIHKIILH